MMVSKTPLIHHVQNKNKDFNIDFIGIGAGKAGTTWVSEMLDTHPEICMSEPKEVHYFNEQGSYYINIETPNYRKGLEWYKKHFLHCLSGQLIGEFSPKYLFDAQAPGRIKKAFPDVKLIVCLRNPVDRAFSQYNFVKYYKKKKGVHLRKSFAKNLNMLKKDVITNT